MQPLQKNPSGCSSRRMPGRGRGSRNLPVVSVVFFGAFYLFLWLFIEPRYIYHYFDMARKSPFFKTGLLFLQNYLSCPSGPSQYLAAFITQLCYFSWLGALCITLIAWGIYRIVVSLTSIEADSPWRVICYIPALLILMISGRYESPTRTAVAILVIGFFSVIYEKLSPRLGPARAFFFLIFSGVLYWIAGSAVLIFVALAALYEFFRQRKPALGVLYLLLGPAVCWLLGAYIFEPAGSGIYLYSNPFVTGGHNEDMEKWARIFEGALFVVLPVAVLLIGLGRRLAQINRIFHSHKQRPRGKSSAKRETSDHFHPGRVKWILQVLLLALIVVPSVFLSFDRKAKSVIQVSYFTCRKMWPELLDVARKIPLKRYFPFCSHAVNRALYHAGRLGDEMFTCPQDYRVADLVFCLNERGNFVYMERAESCLELGLVSAAEKIAHEFMEGSDESPFILKQIALINIVKRQIETARVCLRALSKNLIYGREAKDILRRLKEDPQLEKDKRIKYLRSIMMTEDTVYHVYNEDGWLSELLRVNKHNRMAFEYLMANYLLTKRLDKFVENLHRLDDFGYKEIPRHYQEAILIYTGTTRKKVDLGTRKINAEILKQYNEINEIGRKYGRDNVAVWHRLARKFNGTYFYYFTFGYSGMRR